MRPFSRDPVLLLALALAVAGLAQAWDLGRRSPGLDFYQFWVVAQVAGRDDVPNVYGDEARSRIGAEFVRRSLTDEDSERRRVAAQPWQVLEPTATPLLYTAFRPLTGGSYEDSHFAFRLLGLAACAGGLLLTAHLVGHGPAAALLALAFVAHSFQPLKADIRVGNVNEVQVGVIAAYLWLSSKDDVSRAQIAAGALLALLLLFKPNLLPALPVLAACWCLRGRRRKLARQAAGLAMGTVLGVLLPLLTFGSLDAWPDWLAYLTALPRAKIPLQVGNMGLSRLLFEALGVDLSPLLATAAMAAVLACVWRGRRRAADAPAPAAAIEDTAAVAAGSLVYLLSAPMVWLHYLLLALPAVLLVLRPRREAGFTSAERRGGLGGATVAPPSSMQHRGPTRTWPRVLAAFALVGIAVDPLTAALGVRELRQQALVASLALLSLLALLCLEIAGWAASTAAEGPGG